MSLACVGMCGDDEDDDVQINIQAVCTVVYVMTKLVLWAQDQFSLDFRMYAAH